MTKACSTSCRSGCVTRSASDAEFATAVQQLRQSLPDGGPVHIGFTVYVEIAMGRWDITTEAEAAANLGTTIAKFDAAIARARAHNIPIMINLFTAIRDRKDPAQRPQS